MAAQFQGYIPSSTAVSGGGSDVTKVGTPANNQVGVWTGDGTIEGTSALTFSGTILSTTGAYEIQNAGGHYAFQSTNRGSLRNVAASATVPTVVTRISDLDTGIGGNNLDQLSLIAGGSEIARCIEQGAGNDQFLLAPTLSGNATFPSLAFGDGDSGIYETVDDQLAITIAGSDRWIIAVDQIGGILAGSAMILNETASGTNPTIVPFRTDPDTGIGRLVTDQLSLIAGGVEIARASEQGATARQFIVSPGAVQNVPATPSLAFGDGDTGIYEGSDDNLFVAFTGIESWKWTALEFKGSGATGVPSMINEVSSATNPVWSFQADPDTGIGRAAADQLSLIAGAIEGIRYSEASSHVLADHEIETGITASTTQTQGQRPLLSTWNEIATVANESDTVTAPSAQKGRELNVINNGVNGAQMFPASGDDLGSGVNVAVALSQFTTLNKWIALDSTTWQHIIQ